LLEKEKDVLFASHYGGGSSTHPTQKDIKKILSDHFDLGNDFFKELELAPKNGKENTTRTRSFLFFSYAICLASSFRKEIEVVIPENGLISLNIPLTDSRLGSSSTRTTHPFYIKKLQQLINNLGIEVILKNPYQFKTKGEMISKLVKNDLFFNNYHKTMSCSHPERTRYTFEPPLHCGICFPCVIRRSAILASGIKDKTNYYDVSLNLGNKAKHNLNVYKMGLINSKKIPSHHFAIQLAGPIESNFESFTDVYKKGMSELEDFIGTLDE